MSTWSTMSTCRSRSSRPWATASLLALLLAAGAARAQPAAPADWPCVQRYVPEISVATLWPVPIDPAPVDGAGSDPARDALARDLGELERVDDAARAAMAEYAASLPEDARRDALTRLAEATVDVADERRARYLDGIGRYTRQQAAIAAQIETTLNHLAELDDALATADAPASAGAGTSDAGTTTSAVPEGAAERVAIEDTLAWHERLYDQREHAIRALCERPVALEETLSEVLRELASHLPEA